MSAPSESSATQASATLVLRPEEPGDEQFLFEVYASTRVEELAVTNWAPSMMQAFLNQQFAAMRTGYRSMFPTGKFSIIQINGQAAGRMVIYHGPAEIRVVDIALMPAWRNHGVGTLLMQQVCRDSEQAGKPVRLCVLKNNRARVWYERLGFVFTGENGYYDELEWMPKA